MQFHLPFQMKVDYGNLLTSHPILTKAATSASLCALQEAITRLLTRSSGDNQKLALMTLYGFSISAPSQHYLFNAMERVAARYSVKSAIVFKLLVTNLLISPITITMYLIALCLSTGSNRKQALTIAAGRIHRLVLLNCLAFPLFQILIFRFAKPKYYLPLFNLVGFVAGTVANIKSRRSLSIPPPPLLPPLTIDGSKAASL